MNSNYQRTFLSVPSHAFNAIFGWYRRFAEEEIRVFWRRMVKTVTIIANDGVFQPNCRNMLVIAWSTWSNLLFMYWTKRRQEAPLQPRSCSIKFPKGNTVLVREGTLLLIFSDTKAPIYLRPTVNSHIASSHQSPWKPPTLPRGRVTPPST